jgi:hypothetical protein
LVAPRLSALAESDAFAGEVRAALPGAAPGLEPWLASPHSRSHETMAAACHHQYGILDGVRARRKNFHVPLDEDIYLRLKEEAERSGKPATELARDAIEATLTERRRAQLGESIASYAVGVAGTSNDLDRGLEQAALEHLVKRRRPRR